MIGGVVLGSLLALIWAGDGLRLRGRARAMTKLPAGGEPVAPEHTFIVRPGVVVAEATQRAASAYARREKLEVLDLVPASLPSWRVGLLLSGYDARTYRADRLVNGVGGGDALLVDTALLERVKASSEYPGDPTDLVEMAKLARVLKRYACQSSDLVVTDGVASPPVAFRERGRFLFQLYGEIAGNVQVLLLLVLGVVFAIAPIAGLVALFFYQVQMLIVTLGTAFAPSDRVSYALLRAVLDFVSGLMPIRRPNLAEASRAEYQKLLANGTEPFFEPARPDCPVCASRELTTAFELGDRHQFKPGRFKVSECRGCGHRFQNPRLSIEGLNFYYRDFYDGLGKELLEDVFASDAAPYLARARMVSEVTSPRNWLDVGAGHGHFCNVAREVLPETSFDGLDMTESITDAERRRWVDRGIRGLFPVVAPDIQARGDLYDVVSMSHYLEHTIDPRTEIAAAAKVLPAGGHLLIEVPDPESAFGRVFGRHWMPWFQPQHLNFISVKNLERLLAESGFSVVSCDRSDAHSPTDIAFVTYIAMGNLAPPPGLPWRPPSGAGARLWRNVVWLTMFPVLVAAMLLDHALKPLTRRPGWSNAYRMLARKA